jgi:ribosome-associated protein
MAKSTEKITPVKKTTAKKVAVKKTAAKKTAAKKTTKEEKPAAKKTAAKKVTAVKSVETAPKKAKIVEIMDEGTLLALTVAQGMFEKKAEDIRILDMRKVSGASSDFFVISSASNDKQVEAISRSLEEEVKKHLNQSPWHREGYENLEWVLTDYIDVVAHVFQKEQRDFYDIEGLWGDAIELPFKGK